MRTSTPVGPFKSDYERVINKPLFSVRPILRHIAIGALWIAVSVVGFLLLEYAFQREDRREQKIEVESKLQAEQLENAPTVTYR
ncbi:MAG: hypothetical protein Q8L64_06070 [bacterium]|nr:hypothetical protein [bacterium]